jgi:hypothetical protein
LLVGQPSPGNEQAPQLALQQDSSSDAQRLPPQIMPVPGTHTSRHWARFQKLLKVPSHPP